MKQETPRRIGIMGGTFDPIHHGHLVAGSEVADLFGLDLVLYVPTGDSWQKRDREVTAAEDRYLMSVIATAPNPRFHTSRIEIDRTGPSYTVDTLKELKTIYPDSELFFITGADALARIGTWHNWDELFELAMFVGVTRPGYQLDESTLPPGRRDHLFLVEIPAMAISSTDCRQRVAAGRPVWYLVPDGVVQYIAKRNLYHTDDVARARAQLQAKALGREQAPLAPLDDPHPPQS
ncbi:nicotinate-nucleotide adenylyltransferase [Corynebacterium choanae]|uniref:Probable nicotinate-nucleotide adenylyltransferase n=1 Tax=Corynebacterium choanae TaxID=1862358 RepID=A0A3G6JAY5_9CORY|nr:nicotinate-nucleotide adenylyltransferase [Corynebacterium choanae]AZA14108.1 Nicotinate-nucleotide adenylyltransferase [Corynebacterium choanae]